jgi:hypothetical protein
MQSEHERVDKQGFRLRGAEVSRIDSFSDVVFGFSLTLIVVSQSVPHTFDELQAVLLGFVPFAICFLLFINIWLAHYRFFRRYGVHDLPTMWINFALLFTVLLYVYPLKFLFTFVVGKTPPGVFTGPYQERDLMIVYGAGFAAIQFCFAALYGNAWRQRLRLRLNPLETTLTASSFWDFTGSASIGLICCLMARLLPPDQAGVAGYGFMLLIVWGRLHGFVTKRRIREARARTAAETQNDLPQPA